MQTAVRRLYVHGPRGTRPEDKTPTPMVGIDTVDAVEGMGLREDTRYFRETPDAHDRKRQVSLIDEGTIERLEKIFGTIPQEFVKAQIVLSGDVDLPSLAGSILTFPSGAELTISIERKPCYAMDLIHPGLREAMESGHQGALARVTATGSILVGDAVVIRAPQPVTV